jgi:cobalt-zinc-cadmium resistance protein CzcA
MLQKIISYSIQNKLIVGLGTLILVLTGIYQLKKLPIDALPDITSNQVQVITITPALAAPEVERLITFNVEQSCANIPGITEMRSISRFGLSVVTIVFSDATDIYWARQQVSERMPGIRAQIPAGAGSPELAPLTTGLGEVYQYFLQPQPGYEGKYNLAELRSMQDWIVRRQLVGTTGVADVSSFGGHLLQYEVSVDPQRLNSMGLTLIDVFNAMAANNQNAGGSYIEKGPTAQFIRTEGLATSIEDIEKMVVRKSGNGSPILVRDVAKVRESKAVRYGALVYEDKGEVAGAVVLMLKGANANTVVKAIKEKLAVIEKSLPEGVKITPFYDRTKVVERALDTVTMNLAEGALIVVFILVVFLGNLRAGLIVASVIPLAMLFAICMMNLFGVSGNLMSLGALDFGLIVDGAVIIVEAVLHRLHHIAPASGNRMLSQGQMDHEVEHSSGKMMNAAVFGQIIILIVYLPILTLSGIEGKMFSPMAQTVAFALVGAFLLSLTYVPMVTSLFLSKKWNTKRNLSDRMVDKLRNWYRPLLEKALAKPAPVLGGALLLFIASIFVLFSLGGEFIPELEEGDFAVDTRMMAGTSLTHTVETAQKVAGALKNKYPEIERIVTRVGASEIPTDPMPMEMSDVIILLKPKDEWTSATSYDELADKMSETLADFPGLTAGFQFPIQMRFNELISGARQDVVCKLFGEDLDTLSLYAGKLSALMSGVNGVSDLYVETVTGLPQIQVKYDRGALARYGVTVSDVNNVVQSAFAGASAGLVYQNERRYDLVVRLEDAYRDDVDHIRQMLIPTSAGQQIPLYLLADVQILEGPNQIQRENAKRRIIVSFNVRGRDVESVVKDVQEKVNSGGKLPAGYYLHFGGAFENLQEARQRLGIAVPVSLLLILFLLYSAFQSAGPGLIIFTAIPMSAIGGIFALWSRGMPFSISAGIGFIALFGVSVLNGIVLLTEIRRMNRAEAIDLKTSILEGCISRLRPVLMTAAVASFGFLPMALSSRAGAEVQRPLATVVIAGLISSTILTLFVLPILYQWMENRARKVHKRPPVINMIMVIGLMLPALLQAQEKVSLPDALQKIRQMNPQAAAANLHAEYRGAIRGTAKMVPKTYAELEGGQSEGPYFDLRLSASQNFQPMGLVKRQQDLYNAQYESALLQTALLQKDLDKLTRQLYNQYAAGKARLLLLEKMDTLLQKSIRVSKLRVNAGESDKMELVNLELLANEWIQMRMMTESHQQSLRRRLAILLQMEGEAEPVISYTYSPSAPILADTGFLQKHPAVLLRLQDVKAAALFTKVEEALYNPEWFVGFTNKSVTGWQSSKDNSTETFYDMGNRFFSGTVGLNFPLFNKGGKARVAAAGIQEKYSTAMQDYEVQQLKLAYSQSLTEWQGLFAQLKHYENNVLPGLNSVLETALRRYQTGGINYLEWSMTTRQALQTELSYIDVRRQLEDKIIDLQYFNEN